MNTYHEWNQLAVHKKPPEVLRNKLQLPVKTLTGPGPTNCSKRVLQSLKNQVLGHLHPEVCVVGVSFYLCPSNCIKKYTEVDRYR